MKIDRQIVDLFNEAPNEALKLVYKYYYDFLYKIAYMITFDKQDAEDVVQESIIKIYLTFESYDSKKSGLANWMGLIVKSKAIDLIRSADKKKVDRVEVEFWLNLRSFDADVDLDLIDVFDNVDKLKTEFSNPVYLAYYYGFTHKQMTEIMNVGYGAIKHRLKQAKKALRLYYTNSLSLKDKRVYFAINT